MEARNDVHNSSNVTIPTWTDSPAYVLGASSRDVAYMIIPNGEDIFTTILSYAENMNKQIAIFWAVGSVSGVTFRKFAPSTGTITYEGPFRIASLSGDIEPSRESAGPTAILISESGHVINGMVEDLLIAHGPVQVLFTRFTSGEHQGSEPNHGDKDIPKNSSLEDSHAVPKSTPHLV